MTDTIFKKHFLDVNFFLGCLMSHLLTFAYMLYCSQPQEGDQNVLLSNYAPSSPKRPRHRCCPLVEPCPRVSFHHVSTLKLILYLFLHQVFGSTLFYVKLYEVSLSSVLLKFTVLQPVLLSPIIQPLHSVKLI